MTNSSPVLLDRHGHGRFIFYKLMTAIPVFAAFVAILPLLPHWRCQNPSLLLHMGNAEAEAAEFRAGSEIPRTLHSNSDVGIDCVPDSVAEIQVGVVGGLSTFDLYAALLDHATRVFALSQLQLSEQSGSETGSIG